jgi:hypothetical protein
MSGGSYSYAYARIEDLATEIRGTSPLRRAFKAHLRKVAAACRDIEWVDSNDCAPGEEDEAIRACLGKNGQALVLAEAVAQAKLATDELIAAINAVNTSKPRKANQRSESDE